MCSPKAVFVRQDPFLRPGAKIGVGFGGWTEIGGYSAGLAALIVLETSQLGAEQDRSDGCMLPRMSRSATLQRSAADALCSSRISSQNAL